MKKLIKELEIIGQTTSLKQHNNIKDLIESGNHSKNLINEALKNSHELICMVHPEDDSD